MHPLPPRQWRSQYLRGASHRAAFKKPGILCTETPIPCTKTPTPAIASAAPLLSLLPSVQSVSGHSYQGGGAAALIAQDYQGHVHCPGVRQVHGTQNPGRELVPVHARGRRLRNPHKTTDKDRASPRHGRSLPENSSQTNGNRRSRLTGQRNSSFLNQITMKGLPSILRQAKVSKDC